MIISIGIFLDNNRILCFRCTEDVVARIFIPVISKKAVLRAVHGHSLLAGHPGIDHITRARENGENVTSFLGIAFVSSDMGWP